MSAHSRVYRDHRKWVFSNARDKKNKPPPLHIKFPLTMHHIGSSVLAFAVYGLWLPINRKAVDPRMQLQGECNRMIRRALRRILYSTGQKWKFSVRVTGEIQQDRSNFRGVGTPLALQIVDTEEASVIGPVIAAVDDALGQFPDSHRYPINCIVSRDRAGDRPVSARIDVGWRGNSKARFLEVVAKAATAVLGKYSPVLFKVGIAINDCKDGEEPAQTVEPEDPKDPVQEALAFHILGDIRQQTWDLGLGRGYHLSVQLNRIDAGWALRPSKFASRRPATITARTRQLFLPPRIGPSGRKALEPISHQASMTAPTTPPFPPSRIGPSGRISLRPTDYPEPTTAPTWAPFLPPPIGISGRDVYRPPTPLSPRPTPNPAPGQLPHRALAYEQILAPPDRTFPHPRTKPFSWDKPRPGDEPAPTIAPTRPRSLPPSIGPAAPLTPRPSPNPAPSLAFHYAQANDPARTTAPNRSRFGPTSFDPSVRPIFRPTAPLTPSPFPNLAPFLIPHYALDNDPTRKNAPNRSRFFPTSSGPSVRPILRLTPPLAPTPFPTLVPDDGPDMPSAAGHRPTPIQPPSLFPAPAPAPSDNHSVAGEPSQDDSSESSRVVAGSSVCSSFGGNFTDGSVDGATPSGSGSERSEEGHASDFCFTPGKDVLEEADDSS
ncbi:hypothetical protein BZA05DRAFT_416017 [Tricharina praecox]|uniref:uncharacterized protein n=1 Tax=Tricharina praecox TaxID=43433 RepID=UPI0022202CD3|nr:uncharacterized protein BZA05DRAFT_416017 [Tricharina praecox]KAI5856316.1 hypothetical protein BZA05DRAFT_416017 [Tricharina praecox]